MAQPATSGSDWLRAFEVIDRTTAEDWLPTFAELAVKVCSRQKHTLDNNRGELRKNCEGRPGTHSLSAKNTCECSGGHSLPPRQVEEGQGNQSCDKMYTC